MSGQAERNGEENTGSASAERRVESDEVAELPEDGAREAEADTMSALEARADENWDKYLRAAAELDNVRKRAARDVENARRFALERFARELLAVRDSLELGIAAGAEGGAESLLSGSEATLKLLATTMQQFGVAEVDPLGEPFDPELHEAMTVQPSAEVEPGSVLTVFQKGYTLNGRLLRPARVVVAEEMPREGNSG
jgi:molecular chaperone GrpE